MDIKRFREAGKQLEVNFLFWGASVQFVLQTSLSLNWQNKYSWTQAEIQIHVCCEFWKHMKRPEHSHTFAFSHCTGLLPKIPFVVMDWETLTHKYIHRSKGLALRVLIDGQTDTQTDRQDLFYYLDRWRGRERWKTEGPLLLIFPLVLIHHITSAYLRTGMHHGRKAAVCRCNCHWLECARSDHPGWMEVSGTLCSHSGYSWFHFSTKDKSTQVEYKYFRHVHTFNTCNIKVDCSKVIGLCYTILHEWGFYFGDVQRKLLYKGCCISRKCIVHYVKQLYTCIVGQTDD